jgi:RluA family pseudouridine synthase
MIKITCKVPTIFHDDLNSRLDRFIFSTNEAKQYKLSRSMIRKLINVGAVYVNSKRVKIASRKLRGGEIIDIYYDEKKSFQTQDESKFLPLKVVYIDEAILCIDKPAGLPTQPTLDNSRLNLYELAKRQFIHNKKDEAKKTIENYGLIHYLGLHHRLDKDTSGVVLFTIDKKYNSYFANLFKNHEITKHYFAVVHGKIKKEKGRLESFLAQVNKSGKQAKYGSVRSGGKKAITDYQVIASNDKFSLVQVNITTGRTHQIRVHFSEIGHPIVGDVLYGSPKIYYEKLGRHLLHAHALNFKHPITLNQLRVESPIPLEFREFLKNGI